MRKSLDTYEYLPSEMRNYLSFYGFHFSKRAYEYASKHLKRYNAQKGKMEAVTPYTKEEVDNILSKYGVNLQNKILYDYVYVASMAKADYLGSSIPDERYLALFIRDYVDDPDASEETTFRRWLATEAGNGNPVDFADLLGD